MKSIKRNHLMLMTVIVKSKITPTHSHILMQGRLGIILIIYYKRA